MLFMNVRAVHERPSRLRSGVLNATPLDSAVLMR